MTLTKTSYLEIGPGRGDFLFQLATENPQVTIAAIEYKPKRYEKLLARMKSRQLTNIQLHLGDAKEILPEAFLDESLEKIFILFSDPWPKNRHAHHRLFQHEFVAELLRVLKPGGLVYIAHDDANYVHQIRQVFLEFLSSFESLHEGVEAWTFYADKWKKEGRQIQSFSYRKLNHQMNCNNDRDYLALPCVDPTHKAD